MHVGGLFLFEIPENAPETFVHDLVEEIRQSKSIPVPPFNNRLNGLFGMKMKSSISTTIFAILPCLILVEFVNYWFIFPSSTAL